MDAYIQVIREAFLFFPIIAALLAVPYILYNYHKFGSVLSLRVVIIYSFILYLLCALFLVILPLPTRAEAAALTTPRVQKIPFHCMQDILREYRESGGGGLLALINNRAFLQVAFNVIMLVPFGVYLRYYFRCGFFTTMVLSFLLSLFFELTQLSGLYFIYPRSYRLFDVDDLMSNTFGGICGYIGVTPFLWLLPSRAEMDDRSFRLSREVSAFRRLTAALFDLFWAGGVSLLVCLLVKRKMGPSSADGAGAGPEHDVSAAAPVGHGAPGPKPREGRHPPAHCPPKGRDCPLVSAAGALCPHVSDPRSSLFPQPVLYPLGGPADSESGCGAGGKGTAGLSVLRLPSDVRHPHGIAQAPVL